VPGGIEASQDVERSSAARAVSPGERLGRGDHARTAVAAVAGEALEDRQRADEERPGRFDRCRRDPVHGDELEARGEIEPAAVPRFGDQRVEHADPSRWPRW
jgi:hypothetical protein